MRRYGGARWSTSTRARAGLATVAVGTAAFGCGLQDGSGLDEAALHPTTSGATTTSAPSDALAPTYEEGPCPFDEPAGVEVTCGTLTVARDRAHPDEGYVTVAVARLAARADEPEDDPILYFEGGPGGASLIYADWWADHRLLQDRDIILFDQRGTGYSSPNLSCAPEWDTSSASAADADVYEDCYDRLAAKTDPADFTTREAAHDVADLMDVLDLHDVDLLGVSYGTRLAMVTAELAPDRVRSVVLDSVYPPGVEALELLASNGERAFEALYAACTDDEECAAAYGDVEATLHAAVEGLDSEPREIQLTDDDTGEREPTSVAGVDLVDAVFSALYDLTLIPEIPHAIALAEQGDVASVQEAFDLLYGEDVYVAEAAAADEPEDSSDGLYYSVTCSEEMPMTTRADVVDGADTVDAVLRDDLSSSAEYDVDVCAVWDAGQATAEPLEPVVSELPALLLGGSLDPITPPFWARDAAEGFAHGFFVELDGVGHGVMDSHLCGYELVKEFLDDPSHAPDNSCIERTHPPAFTVK